MNENINTEVEGVEVIKYGYCRVSGLSQDLEEQIEKVKKEGVSEENIFAEKVTGTKKDREQLNKLLEVVKSGDIIYITKLDRLARNMKDALNIIDELKERGVILHVLHVVGRLDGSMGATIQMQMILMFAEFERNMIVERLNEGKEWHKANNPDFKEGRPSKLDDKKLEKMMKLKESKTMTNKEIAEMYNISLRSFYNYSNIYKQQQEAKNE